VDPILQILIRNVCFVSEMKHEDMHVLIIFLFFRKKKKATYRKCYYCTSSLPM